MARNDSSAISSATIPDSIFDRSRMSLIRLSRSWPLARMMFANSTCFEVRLPSEFSASCSARISRLLRGVRS